MKVLNYGSLNVDYVYSVDHIIVGGETQHSSKLEVFSGGKGLNQSIALAKAGVPVYHAGIVGSDGDILLDACKEAGVNTKYIRRLPVKGGHTMIQVDKNAQNCIILYGGTNQMQTREFVDEVLADFGEGDYLLLQVRHHRCSLIGIIVNRAATPPTICTAQEPAKSWNPIWLINPPPQIQCPDTGYTTRLIIRL